MHYFVCMYMWILDKSITMYNMPIYMYTHTHVYMQQWELWVHIHYSNLEVVIHPEYLVVSEQAEG